MLGSVIAEVTTFGNPLHIVLTLTSLWRKPADTICNKGLKEFAALELHKLGFQVGSLL